VSGLRRELGLPSAVAITVGGVIGSGIFMKPLDLARSLPSEGWIHAAWIGLGLVCLCGALAYAELGAMFPSAGGQYAFLREAYGRFVAFLYGWCFGLAISTGGIAALAVAFGQAFGRLAPLPPGGETAVALAMIAGPAAVNHAGVRRGALLQNAATLAKVAALAAIALAGLRAVAPATPQAPSAPPTGSGIVAACIAVFWAYEGWYQLPFSAAELRRPERDLPRGLIIGMAALIVLYVLVNAAYLAVVPLPEMRGLAHEVDVPLRTLERAFGAWAAAAFPALLCVSVAGAANPNFLSNSRAFFEMARDGLMPARVARVSPATGTPAVAIWAQAAWSAVLVLVLRTFRDITEYVIFVGLVFFALTTAAVYVLRRRSPDLPRPFRCPGYPVTPAVFIVAALAVDARMLLDPELRTNALIGLAILAAGVPFFALTRPRPVSSPTDGGPSPP
jgi:basic amino acid/polyamine antiporter, APA family